MDNEFLPPEAREKIFAAAAGTGAGRIAFVLGADAAALCEALLTSGAGVFVADPSAEKLSRLAERFAPRFPRRLATLCGAAAALPLPDATADIAFSVTPAGDDPWSALPELARILRPSGKLILFAPLGGPSGRSEALKRFAAAGLLAGAERVEIGASWLLASGRKPLWRAALDEKAARTAGASANASMQNSPSFCCTEAMLLAVAETLGLSSPLLPRIGSAFCAGIALTDSHCGIYSGGVAALGLALGRDRALEDHGLLYASVQDFHDYFLSEFHTLDCRELTGCDLTDPAGVVEFGKRGCKTAICGKILEACTSQVVSIIADIADVN